VQPANLGPPTVVRIGGSVSGPTVQPPGTAAPRSLATTGLPADLPLLAVGLLGVAVVLRRRRAARG
jgi:hypothetical protein